LELFKGVRGFDDSALSDKESIIKIYEIVIEEYQMRAFSPFDKMNREQKVKFLYIDAMSRNLADEKMIKKKMQEDLKEIDKTAKKSLTKKSLNLKKGK